MTHFRQLHCEIVGIIRILLLYSQWPFNLPPRCQFELKYWHYQIAAVVFTSIFNDFTPSFTKSDIKHLLWHFIHSIYPRFFSMGFDPTFTFFIEIGIHILFSDLNLLAFLMIKPSYISKLLKTRVTSYLCMHLKFIYFEKATKFCEKSIIDLSVTT